MVVFIILSLIIVGILGIINASPNQGRIADPGLVCFPLICLYGLFYLLFLAFISELGRYAFEERFKWWVSTPIMFIVYTMLIWLNFYPEYLGSSMMFDKSHLHALFSSIPYGAYMGLYWIILLLSKLFFRKVTKEIPVSHIEEVT